MASLPLSYAAMSLKNWMTTSRLSSTPNMTAETHTCFKINPLGTQRDGLITDEQVGDTQDGDPGWDGVWTSEARITDDGWTATIAIPFSTLNFMSSRDVVWGINFKRFIRRKNEEDLWSGWRRTFGATKVSQAGQLHGITDIGSSRLFVVKPYGLAGFNHLPPNAAAYGLTPGTSPLLTLRPLNDVAEILQRSIVRRP